MTTLLIALIVFAFTTFLSVAGVGAAFIVVPVMFWFGIPLPVAMATGLLLNGVSMTFASANYARYRFIMYRWAAPVAVVAILLSPIGVYSSQFVSQSVLLWLFSSFLLFAALMTIFYKPKQSTTQSHVSKGLPLAAGLGGVAGYVGGMLGVGGGNIIVPVLVWLGFEPKKASGTTAFVVVFSSLAGFLARTSLGSLDHELLLYTLFASIIGALVGSWLTKRLNNRQVKLVIGVMLFIVAAKMIWGLI